MNAQELHEIRRELMNRGQREVDKYVAELNANPVILNSEYAIPYTRVDFASDVNRKRTFKTIINSIDKKIRDVKFKLSNLSENYIRNIKTLSELKEDERAAFTDLDSYVLGYSAEYFASIVRSRLEYIEEYWKRISEEDKSEEERKENLKYHLQVQNGPNYIELIAVIANHYRVSIEVAEAWLAELLNSHIKPKDGVEK